MQKLSVNIIMLCDKEPFNLFVSLCPGSGWREGEDDKQCQRTYEGQQSPWRAVGGRGARSPHLAQRITLSERRGRVLTEKKNKSWMWHSVIVPVVWVDWAQTVASVVMVLRKCVCGHEVCPEGWWCVKCWLWRGWTQYWCHVCGI